MLTTLHCAGHPRDMGLAQGTAARHAIRAEAARLGLPLRRSRMPDLRALAVGPVRGIGSGRELFRHFAHLAERVEGVAKTSALPLDAVVEMHLRVRAGGEAGGLLSRRATLSARALEGGTSEKHWTLERSLPSAHGGEADWVVRSSRPAVGFASVEVGLPWLVSSVAGVNEAGLAVVAGPLLWGPAGREGHPTSLLLVQECLQRFGDLDGALDWCSKRPVEGEQSLVLADATGRLATVVFSGQSRRVQYGESELQLEAGEPEPSGDVAPEGLLSLDPTEGLLRFRRGNEALDLRAGEGV